ncbi:hypothetical protein ACLIKC_01485 [Klebsiella aerogenes]|uniref:hypothetical protein n=1 Tax=Klebsiella aerogenes TaxID=548 RepID=UPI003A94ECE9
MKRFVLAALVCSLLAGCKYDLSFNTDSAKKVNDIDNYKCVQYMPQQGDVINFSLNRDTGMFVDDVGNEGVLKNTDNVWSRNKEGQVITIMEQGNVGYISIEYPDIKSPEYSYSCHKEKAIG